MKSAAQLLAAVALLSGTTNAFWRMQCKSEVMHGRVDPIVDFGKISTHGHLVFGASKFREDSTYDTLRQSNCTSCQFGDDKSAYWTPSLHFMYKNGTTQLVQNVGGMLAYYLLLGDDIKAFPEGFQMLAGDTRLRNFSRPVPDPPTSDWTAEDMTQVALGQKAIGFNCMNYNKAPEGSRQRHTFPEKSFMDQNCTNGIRAEILFPSCWNGNDTQSKDHKSHVAYPSLLDGGVCPEGFPVRLPTLFYETIWNTYAFKDEEGTFVFSNGDPTGCGYHADFIGGWKVSTLQKAIDTCTNPSGRVEDCPVFASDLQSESQQAQCKIEEYPSMLHNDNCDGPIKGLCGGVPLQPGPHYALPLGEHGDAKPHVPNPAPVVSVPPQKPAPAVHPVEPAPKVVDAIVNAVTPAAVNTILPAVTPAAQIKDAPPKKDDHILSTTTYQKDGVVYEVCIKEVEVTVTVSGDEQAATPAHYRRHAHRHRRDNALGHH